jgi:hypothetical protein
MRNKYKILVQKTRRRREYNIKMGPEERVCEDIAGSYENGFEYFVPVKGRNLLSN